MASLSIEDMRWILLFVVPGFISMKVYDLRVPGQPRDLSKSLVEAVTFGSINLAVLYPLVGIDWNYATSLLVLFLAPIVWPLLYIWILSWRFVRKHTIHPIAKPWDYVFSKQGPLWVIVHMKDGRRIAGRYDKGSFASSYPAEEQLYLHEVWRLDAAGRFTEAVERSAGILLSFRDVDVLEFFHDSGGTSR